LPVGTFFVSGVVIWILAGRDVIEVTVLSAAAIAVLDEAPPVVPAVALPPLLLPPQAAASAATLASAATWSVRVKRITGASRGGHECESS
jgi:hypothetical protein